MGGLGNKEIFSRNLRRYMDSRGKDRAQVCADLGFKYTTFADWYNGKKYPRIDKIELLANYFGVSKSDLIEEAEQTAAPKDDGLTDQERELIRLLRTLPPASQDAILQQLQGLALLQKAQGAPEEEQ